MKSDSKVMEINEADSYIKWLVIMTFKQGLGTSL